MIEPAKCTTTLYRENIARLRYDAYDTLVAFGVGTDRAWIFFRYGMATTTKPHAIFYRNNRIRQRKRLFAGLIDEIEGETCGCLWPDCR